MFDLDSKLFSPERLDLEVTGRCPMRCDGCWGPSHSLNESTRLLASDWLDVVRAIRAINLPHIGTLLGPDDTNVCVTGGEPLLYPGLLELLSGLRDEGIRTTLSTTGIGPVSKLVEALDMVADVGIPIDSPDPGLNSLWRVGRGISDGGLEHALIALRVAQQTSCEVTLRTMVHPRTLGSLAMMAGFLDANDVDCSRIRWKLYPHRMDTGQNSTVDEHIWKLKGDDIVTIERLLATTEFREVEVFGQRYGDERLIIDQFGNAHFRSQKNIYGSSGRNDIHVGYIKNDLKAVIDILCREYPLFMTRANRGFAEQWFFYLAPVLLGSGELSPEYTQDDLEYMAMIYGELHIL